MTDSFVWSSEHLNGEIEYKLIEKLALLLFLSP